MFTRIATRKRNLIAFKVDGRPSAPDLKEVTEQIEKTIADNKPDKIRIIVELHNIHFPELSFFREDLKFIFFHLNDIERFAAVGDKGWEKWWTAVVGSFVPLDAKFFDVEERDEAWRWIRY